MSEQLALHELAADGGAVHRDEGPVLARAAVVQRLRHELLAGAALAEHEHGEVGLRDLLHRLEDTCCIERPGTDQVLEAVLPLDLLAQQTIFALEARAFQRALTTDAISSLSKGFGT